MKRIHLYIIIFFSYNFSNAQCLSNDPTAPCCNELIHIDPHNSFFTVNNERSDINFKALNFLQWTNTAQANFLHNKIPGNNPSILTNPWVQYVANLYPFFTNYSISGLKDQTTNTAATYSNMDPRYGWELMHSATNYQPFSTIPLLASDPGFSNGPYLLFYNKYTGHLRTVVYPEGYSGANSMQFRIGFNISTKHPDNNNSWYASGLFNMYNKRMQALDEKTLLTDIFAIADNTQGGGDSRPYIGEFNLSYDPCVCNTLPELEIDVYSRTKLKMYAEGRLVALSSPFDKSGNAPLNFGKDFMSSVYGDYINGSGLYGIRNGLLLYNKADQRAKDFYVSDEMQLLSKGLGLFGKAVNSISFSSGITPASLLGDLAFLPASIRNDTSKIKVPIGNLLSAGFDKLSSAINPPTPNVFFIEGQMALRGEIENNFSWSGFNKKSIGHPGSPINKTVGKHNYPYYNEAPGLFALLKTPQIDFSIQRYRRNWFEPVGNGLLLEHSRDRNTGFDIDITNGDLEYALNPAAEINLEESKIYASIEFDLYSQPRFSKTTCFGCPSQYVIYNDFWGIEYGDSAKYKIDINQDLRKKNNFYDEHFLKAFRRTNPFVHSSKEYIKKPDDILSKSFYIVNSDTPYWDDIKKSVNEILGAGSSQCINIAGLNLDADFEEAGTNMGLIWKNKFKNRIFKNTIQTAIMSIENLAKINFREIFDHLNYISEPIAGSSCSNVYQQLLDPRLKIVAHYKFKPNQYGEVNETEQIYNYKLNTNLKYVVNKEFLASSKPSLNQLSSDITIGNTSYTTPTDVYGKNVIINGTISSNGSKVRIYASQSVTIVPPGSVDPNVEIVILDVFDQAVLNPASTTQIASYCNLNTGNYKAKEPVNKASIVSINNGLKKPDILSITLYPNPTMSNTTLKIDNPTSEKIHIKVYDIIGKELLSQQADNISRSQNSMEVNTSALNSGIYIVKVWHGEIEQSLKLEIQK
jgi:hypothetical protein